MALPHTQLLLCCIFLDAYIYIQAQGEDGSFDADPLLACNNTRLRYRTDTAMTIEGPVTIQHVLAGLFPSSVDNIFYVAQEKSGKCPYEITDASTRLLKNEDPFGVIAQLVGKDGVSVVTTDALSIMNGLPHLYILKDVPLVINVDMDLQDYSVVPALKDLGFASYVSANYETLIANGKQSFQVALETLQPVLHFIDFAALTKTSYVAEVTSEIDAFPILATSQAPDTLLFNLSSYGEQFAQHAANLNIQLTNINQYRPWKLTEFLQTVPNTIKRIVIVQGYSRGGQSKAFDPLLLDFFQDFAVLVQRGVKQVVLTNVGKITDAKTTLQTIVDNVRSDNPDQHLYLGKPTTSPAATQFAESVANVVKLETAYLKVLHELFSTNLDIINEYGSDTANVAAPEYGFGSFLRQDEARGELVALVKKSLDPSLYHTEDAGELVQLLSQWVALHDANLGDAELGAANEVAAKIFNILQSNQDSAVALDLLKVAPREECFQFKSHWLVGSDAWSYDLGHSGVHQVLASKKNINLLIIDSEPYEKSRANPRHKKNVGLYAMNFHDVYVASVAVYSSYTQLLAAFLEASAFNGPSVVLAYLPYSSEKDTPLEVLRETKNAVECGYWPLYRYNPAKDADDAAFTLDSAVIRKELQSFLDRENKLSLLTKRTPELARDIEASASDVISRKVENRAKAAYDQLLEGLSGPPLHIYYASDGGNATALAKRLGNRASARGLKSTVLSMDDIILEDLAGEENVIFVTSTAGQGEFPQDGKTFWEELKGSLDVDLASLNFSVFGLGDSQYWPRKEDARYYNKPAKDLFARLELLTANPIVPLGLGDDQDADGYQTGYAEWEKQLWEVLGVSGADVPEEKEITNEDIKSQSNFLRGTIVDGLNDKSAMQLAADDQQLLKFHGCYSQNDRDVLEARKAQGLEPLYSVMARIRLPGGVATPEQWLVLNRLSDEDGNGTMKITTRATFQLHCVLKNNLKHTIRAMNSTLMDTLAAAGDVNRNTMCSALPANAKVHKQVSEMGAKISEHFLPKTTAYYEIWLQGPDERDYDSNWEEIFGNREGGPTKKKALVAGNSLVDIEPLYSPVYLPRKFKVNITVPPYNDVDVWSSDVGLIAIVDPATDIVKGYNMYTGGGMGTTHNNKKTYPRTGSLLGFVAPEEVVAAIEAVMIIQRDNGSRTDRKHARLKYTIDDMTKEVSRRRLRSFGADKFDPRAAIRDQVKHRHFGWVKDETGLNHFTAFIENGRVEDTPDRAQKTGLRKIAELMQKQGSGNFRLTGNQHVVISSIKDEHLDAVKALMKKYSLDNTELSGLRQSSSSCVGLPTCGLAFSESERYLPVLITELEEYLEECGLRHDSIVMRMTGCPNGCSRPYLAEVAIIGKSPHIYNIMLGGGYYGQRLNKLYKSSVKDDDIPGLLKPLFKRWMLEREDGEHFGDFVVRAGIVKPTLEGRLIHEDVSEDVY
ncbi:uncharacterized protein KNAG_0B06860 [Huiozyma naganishii CBS 8797]|uniref:Sulfite reductase [NADPH] subunit beta n=1 Tax=Huiozyma naganishii (strain ATCC MYA-139 / BCRC 22969 / CBS 8797 / KCTC 17520 / NBRC 10181 / NCYC 3082 / Yp74L-3) TaxID=1071383 RepID=J7R2R2_HUIN7|nr:hypothetical protein KNAG_0B06860 [Kazachstania naganishii CBS 8797]CCK69110.1 hypothetical protein KNAG_0B06860 [Kazachstania naganishii CBS 8797]